MSGRTQSAIVRSRESLALAERLDDSDLLLEALHCAWAIRSSVGDVQGALDAIDRGLAIYDPARHHAHVTKFGNGHDSGVCGSGLGSSSLMISGRVAQGRTWVENTLSLGARLEHPFSKAIGLQHAGCASIVLGDYAEAVRLAGELRELAEPRKFVMPLQFSDLILGAGLAGIGRLEEGIAALSGVIDDPKNAVPANWRPLFGVELALALFALGDPDAARARLRGTVEYAKELGGCYCEPLIYVALARVCAANDTDRAYAHLEVAIAMARGSGSRLLELRAHLERLRISGDLGAPQRAAAIVEMETVLATFAGVDADCVYVREAMESLAAARASSAE